MRAAALIIAALLASFPALAQTPAPLPPPILVPNVTPPLTIPSEMVAELQNGRVICERKLAKFDINLNHLERLDFNGDGVEDFIMSSAGYLCNDSHTEFASLTGDEYFIFSSLPGGKYLRHGEAIRAFEMTLDNGFKPPHLLFTVQCPHKFGREFSGHTRLRWNGDQLKAVTRNAGCDGTPPDTSVAAADESATPLTSGPRIERSKAPPLELDITQMDQDTVGITTAAEPEQPAETDIFIPAAVPATATAVTGAMPPDHVAAAPATAEAAVDAAPPPVETAAVPVPPVPMPAASAPILPGATFPAILSAAPAPVSPNKTPSAEDLLRAPAKPFAPAP